MAGKQFTIYGEIKVDSNDLKRDLREIGRELKTTTKQIDKAEAETKRLGKSNNTTARSYDKMRSEVDRTRTRLAQAHREYKKGNITTKQYTSKVKQAANATQRLSSRLRDTSARLKDASTSSVGFATKIGLAAAAGGAFIMVAQRMVSALGDAFRGYVRLSLELDASRKRLNAVAGGIKEGAKAWKMLNAISRESIGVTRTSAREMFGLLKAFEINEGAIKELIPALGKMNAAFTIPDLPKLTNNLKQLFTEGFQVQDYREALDQLKNFPDILRKAFGTADPEQLRTMIKNGELSADAWWKGLAKGMQQSTVGQNAVESASLRIKKSTEVIKEELVRIFDNVGTGWFESIATALEDVAVRLESANTLQDVGVIAGGAIGEFLGKTLRETLEALGPAIWADFAGDAEKGIISEFASRFHKGFWGDALGIGVAEELGRGFDERFVAGLASGMPMISQVLNGIESLIRAPWAEMIGFFEDVGIRLMEGLANGIRAAKDRAVGAMNWALDQVRAIPGAKFIFGSPSKLFAKYGRWLMEGLAQGIEKNTVKVTAAMKKMAARVKAVTERAIKQIQDFFFWQRMLGAEGGRSIMVQGGVFNPGFGAFGNVPDTNNPPPALRPGLPPELSEATPERVLSAWEKVFDRIMAFKRELPSLKTSLMENLGFALMSIGDIFADAFLEWDGTVKGFFRSLAQGFAQMAREIIAQLIRIMIYKAVFSIIGAFAGGGFNANGTPSVHGGAIGGGGGHASPGAFGFGASLATAGAGASMMSSTTTNNSFSPNVSVNMTSVGSAMQAQQSAQAAADVMIKKLEYYDKRNR